MADQRQHFGCHIFVPYRTFGKHHEHSNGNRCWKPARIEGVVRLGHYLSLLQSSVGMATLCRSLPGAYALILSSRKAASVKIGKLGTLQLQRGFYVYIGSSHGPGGLFARLAHHLKPTAPTGR